MHSSYLPVNNGNVNINGGGPGGSGGDGCENCKLVIVVPKFWKWAGRTGDVSRPIEFHRLPDIHSSEVLMFKDLLDSCWENACADVSPPPAPSALCFPSCFFLFFHCFFSSFFVVLFFFSFSFPFSLFFSFFSLGFHHSFSFLHVFIRVRL